MYGDKLELQTAAMGQFGGAGYEQGIKWWAGGLQQRGRLLKSVSWETVGIEHGSLSLKICTSSLNEGFRVGEH